MSEASIANWLTLILGGVTAWMAFATQQMAKATREMAKLDAEPYLSFVSLKTRSHVKDAATGENSNVGVQAILRFKNPGRVRITYEIEHLDFTLKGKQYPSKDLGSVGNVLHPGEEGYYYSSIIPSDVVMEPGDGGLCSLKIAFWRNAKDRKLLSLEMRFIFEKVNDQMQVRALYLEGPTYT